MSTFATPIGGEPSLPDEPDEPDEPGEPGEPGGPSSSGLGPIGRYEDSLQLLRRFRADGDANALNALFERYYERVRRIARIRMGSRLQRLTESDDLVQNTFAVAFKKLEDLQVSDHASLIQYLSAVLENQIRDAIDYFDARKRSPDDGRVLSTDRSEEGDEPIEPVSPEPGPPEQVASRELGLLYDQCVQALDPLHREVILLREYAEASWSEIAARLDRPNERAAMQLYARAQIKLAARLRRRLGR